YGVHASSWFDEVGQRSAWTGHRLGNTGSLRSRWRSPIMLHPTATRCAMSGRLLPLTDALQDYVDRHSAREHPVLAELRAATRGMKHAGMQIGSDQGALMALLVKLIGARRALEIGVFTGYSSLAVALALPADGRLVACDVSEEWTALARKFWEKAGVDKRIELRLQPAQRTLDELIAAGESASFDFAFIDADKSRYMAYYERCLTLLRKG